MFAVWPPSIRRRSLVRNEEMNRSETANSITRRRRPAAGLSPSIGAVEPTERLRSYCIELADSYASIFGAKFGRWMPGVLLALGVVAAFSLMYVELAWYFFGVGFAFSGLAVCLLLERVFGLRPLRTSIARWVRVWPLWEYVVFGLLTVSFLCLALWTGVWGSLLMGLVVGAAVPAIFYLTVGMSLLEQRAEASAKFGKLVDDLRGYGLSPLMIEGGMPKLMGVNWIPLFECRFGYAAYRSVAQQISQIDPDLLIKRPRIRDLFVDIISNGTRSNRGIFGTAWDARREQLRNANAKKILAGLQQATEESDSCAPDESFDAQGNAHVLSDQSEGIVALEPEVVIGNSPPSETSLHGVFNIHSLSAENLSLYVPTPDLEKISDKAEPSSVGSHPRRRKAEYDRMMSQAREGSELGGSKLEFERVMYRYLGDEMRLIAAMVMAIVVLMWAYQTDMLTTDFFLSVWGAIAAFDPGEVSQSLTRVASALTQSEPRVSPIGISGWGLFLAAIVMGISSEQQGWRYSLFAIPATVIVIAGITATLVAGAPAIVGWFSVGVAALLLVASSCLFQWRSNSRRRA